MELKEQDFPKISLYKLLTGSIVPRPIGWISTVSLAGQPNLAPFSYFNAVCANPPHVMFSSGIRGKDRGIKDTLRNVRATGEFVVNIVTEELAEAMVKTATELPPEINEFEFAGIQSDPSIVVQPPRVAASPIHFECQVTHIIDLGEKTRGSSVVIGRVVHIHIDDDMLYGGDKIDLHKLQPVGRLAGTGYCRVKDIFEIARLPSQIV